MAITIKRAIKNEAKLRMALAGPSGSGKTFTSLLLATHLAGERGVIVVDTERGSASKYADQFTFDVIELESFSPESYIEAINAAEEAGYDVLVIDSISHEWTGAGGMLEIVDGITKRSKSGSSFNAWGEATPRHNKFIEAITRARLHVIVTMRSKQDYILEKDERTGKTTPRKVGMAPIQRDGFEYETDVFAEMDYDNNLLVQKSRCPTLSGAVISKPDSRVADVLKSWLSGAPVPTPSASEIADVRNFVGKVFNFKDEDFEQRWEAAKVHVLGRAIADPDLSSADIGKLRSFAEQTERQRADRPAATATSSK